MLTDGAQDGGTTDPALITDALRQQGVEVLVIGIGSNVKKAELKRLAGQKRSFQQADNFEHLRSEEFASNMTKILCKGKKGIVLNSNSLDKI